MTYILSGIFFLIGLFKNKSKVVFFTMCFLLWILVGWCFFNADTNIYMNRFSLSKYISLNVEPGFELLCKLGNDLGLQYQGFLIIISIIAILLSAYSIMQLTSNYNYVLAMYLMFPFVLDAVQIRNFLSNMIIIFAIRYLLTEKNKDDVKFFTLNLIATTIHFSSFFCLSYILVKKFDRCQIIRITITVSALLILLSLTDVLASIASYFINPVVVYEILNNTIWDNPLLIGKFLRNSISSIGSFILFVYLKNIVINRISFLKRNSDENLVYELNFYYKFIEFVYKLNMIVLIVIPLMIYSLEFYRIQQNLLILNYIVFSFYFSCEKKVFKIELRFIVLVILYALIPLYIYVLSSDGNFRNVFRAIFENNILF